MYVRTIVVDTYALLAWINIEPQFERFRPFLQDNFTKRVISPITLFELKLGLLKRKLPLDEQIVALAFVKTICELHEISEAVALRAAEIKFKYTQELPQNERINLSMADCLAIALAESLNAPLLSGEKGLYKINEVEVLPKKR